MQRSSCPFRYIMDMGSPWLDVLGEGLGQRVQL